jgi:hypothetical protein
MTLWHRDFLSRGRNPDGGDGNVGFHLSTARACGEHGFGGCHASTSLVGLHEWLAHASP